jgi:hypothetical protein
MLLQFGLLFVISAVMITCLYIEYKARRPFIGFWLALLFVYCAFFIYYLSTLGDLDKIGGLPLYLTILSVNSTLMLKCLHMEYQARSPFTGFWLTLFFVYYVFTFGDWGEYFLQLSPQTIEVDVYPAVLLRAHLFVLVVTATLALITWGLAGSIPDRSAKPSGGRALALVLLGIFAARVAYKVWGGSYNIGFAELRESSDVASLLMDTYLGFFVVALGIYFLFSRNYRFTAVAFGLVIANYFLFGGARQQIIIMGLATLVMLAMRRGWRFSAFLLVCALMPFAKIAPRFLAYLRNLGSLGERWEFVRFGDWSLVAEGTSDESQLRFAFYHFVGWDNLPTTFFSYQYLTRCLLFWLPSFAWGIKPADFEYEMYSEFYKGAEGTLHATFFGTIFADTGWNFLPWVAIFFLLRLIWNELHLTMPDVGYWVFWFIFFYLSVMWARGSIYAPIVVLFVLAVLVFTIGGARTYAKVGVTLAGIPLAPRRIGLSQHTSASVDISGSGKGAENKHSPFRV